MPLEVIMPALGMAQDSGQVVAWHKSPGDSVNQGDVLFEVETDKATMEVEAQGSGYLTDVRAQAGEDVPVGHTIALISETPDSGEGDSVVPEATAGDVNESVRTEPPAVERLPAENAVPKAVAETAPEIRGRILASPKARRLALERGIDLRQIRNRGLGQLIHADDVLEFSAENHSAAASPSITAIASDAEFLETLSRLQSDGQGITTGEFAAVTASGAARAAGFNEGIAVRLERHGEAPATLVDPDIPWREPPDQQALPDPDLVLRDLTGTRLTSVHQSVTTTPTLTLASGHGLFLVRLDYEFRSLGSSSALALASGFAERLEAPLRQLL